MKKYLPWLLFGAAIIISISAELYGIIGFGEIFSGTKVHAMVLAASLGIGKLITAAYLHEYWKDLKYSKYYLTSAVITISFMTSMGIYGFLSSGYQSTAERANLQEQRTKLIQVKKNRFETKSHALESEYNQISQNIQILSKSISTDNQYQTIDKRTGKILTQIQKTTKKGVENQLAFENGRRDQIIQQMENLQDSIQLYDVLVLESQAKTQFGSELGPIKYLMEITGIQPGKIVNVFLLLIIFVFDPFAVMLVLASINSWNSRNNDAISPVSSPTIPEPINPISNPEIEVMPEVVISNSPEIVSSTVLKRKRGRPRVAKKIESIDPIVPKSISEPDSDDSISIVDDIKRTVLDNDLSAEVMRNISKSLSSKKKD